MQAGPYAQVTAGDEHTCVLDAAGAASCWGLDSGRQASPPKQAFKRISAGSGFTCGIAKADASLVCWGAGGDGFSASAYDKKLASIEAGSSYLCGVTEASEAYCWGDDTYALPALAKVAEISGSKYGVCVLLESGNVTCYYNGGTFELLPAAHAPYVTLAVGGEGACAVPAGGPIVCEPENASVIAPGPADFP